MHLYNKKPKPLVSANKLKFFEDIIKELLEIIGLGDDNLRKIESSINKELNVFNNTDSLNTNYYKIQAVIEKIYTIIESVTSFKLLKYNTLLIPNIKSQYTTFINDIIIYLNNFKVFDKDPTLFDLCKNILTWDILLKKNYYAYIEYLHLLVETNKVVHNGISGIINVGKLISLLNKNINVTINIGNVEIYRKFIIFIHAYLHYKDVIISHPKLAYTEKQNNLTTIERFKELNTKFTSVYNKHCFEIIAMRYKYNMLKTDEKDFSREKKFKIIGNKYVLNYDPDDINRKLGQIRKIDLPNAHDFLPEFTINEKIQIKHVSTSLYPNNDEYQPYPEAPVNKLKSNMFGYVFSSDPKIKEKEKKELDAYSVTLTEFKKNLEKNMENYFITISDSLTRSIYILNAKNTYKKLINYVIYLYNNYIPKSTSTKNSITEITRELLDKIIKFIVYMLLNPYIKTKLSTDITLEKIYKDTKIAEIITDEFFKSKPEQPDQLVPIDIKYNEIIILGNNYINGKTIDEQEPKILEIKDKVIQTLKNYNDRLYIYIQQSILLYFIYMQDPSRYYLPSS